MEVIQCSLHVLWLGGGRPAFDVWHLKGLCVFTKQIFLCGVWESLPNKYYNPKLLNSSST